MSSAYSSTDSQYQGSQAFNQYLPSMESVNSNTGTLIITKPLISLSGINSGINLNLNLVYMPGSVGVLGLPSGWAFDLSYMLSNASLTSRGKNYILDPNWADQYGYQSGLRYINDHSIKFETIIPSQPLPSGEGTYSYRMTYGDGTHDYFDAVGKLVEHDDRFGNYIQYSYTDAINGVAGNYLQTIKDSYAQIITFSYSANAILISLPNGAQTTINFSDRGVENITDAFQNQLIFNYETISNQPVVNTILYPTGLSTQVLYTALPYQSNEGSVYSFPAVSELKRLNKDNTVLAWARYSYGSEIPGYTFTGYAAHYNLSSEADGLIESNNTTYRYEVLIENLSAEGIPLKATRVYYNYLHLPMLEKQYLVTNGLSNNGYQTLYTYDEEVDWHARTVNYSKPISTTLMVWSNDQNAYISLNKTTKNYDVFGNALEADTALYDRQKTAFVPQNSTVYSYTVASWGGEMPQTAISTDLITGDSKKIIYTLTTDQKNIATEVIQYQNQTGKAWIPWKTKTYTYDLVGRVLSTRLQWSEGSTPDPDSIQSTTDQNNYQYDATKGLLTVINTDALGNQKSSVYNTQLPGAPLVKSSSPLGEIITYAYDALGRLIQKTDAKGFVYRSSYTIATADGKNSVVVAEPTGYIYETDYDALGRSIQFNDNGDPTQKNAGTTNRILSQTVYNSIGEVAHIVDKLGLVTTFQYDGLGRRIEILDPLNNITTVTYDDGNFSITEAVNATLKKITQKDGLSRVLSVETYPDPSDTSITYYRKESYQYNGFGKQVQMNLDQIDLKTKQSINRLTQANWSYDTDDNIIQGQYVGYESTQVQLTKNNTYDLLGQSLHTNKNVVYAGGPSYQTHSDKSKFNRLGDLISKTNTLGQTEVYAYDANRKLQAYTRFDETVFSFHYDENHNLTTRAWVENGTNYKIQYTYNQDNTQNSISNQEATLYFEYYLDRTLKSVTYPQGSQTYLRDSYSRLICQQHVSGAATYFTYNQQGLLSTKRLNNDTLSYQYGTVNHTNGVLTNVGLSGEAIWNYQYQYTGWQVPSAVQITDATKQVVFATSCSYDALNRVISCSQSSGASNKQGNLKSYAYDGLNQLNSMHTVYSDGSPSTQETYTYDGNSNILLYNDNGENHSFEYNAIDQLIGTDVRYDSNGRVISDGNGHLYAYNQLDQMVQLMDANGKTQLTYTYYPDSLLCSRTGNSEQQQFYYDNKVINEISVRGGNQGSPDWTSFLFNQNERFSAYEKDKPSLYYRNAQGSVAEMQASSANSLEYKAYGGLKESSNLLSANTSFAWKQEYCDPSSRLVYLRARFYHPQLMRFMSADPMSFDNKYVFGSGDPINLMDPTGLWSDSAIGALVGSVLEVTAGIGITVFTAGLGAALGGGGLIGAGISGIVYSTTHKNDFNAGAFGIQQAAGFTGGVIAGGGGFAAAGLGSSVAGSASAAVAIGVVAGGSTSVLGQLAANGISGEPLATDLWQSALIGGITGGFAGGMGWRAAGEYAGIHYEGNAVRQQLYLEGRGLQQPPNSWAGGSQYGPQGSYMFPTSEDANIYIAGQNNPFAGRVEMNIYARNPDTFIWRRGTFNLQDMNAGVGNAAPPDPFGTQPMNLAFKGAFGDIAGIPAAGGRFAQQTFFRVGTNIRLRGYLA